MNTNTNTSIIISSCDAFSDTWAPFLTAFFSHWSDCPYPLYLVSINKEVEDNRVHTIKVGKDVSYGYNLRRALDKIDSEYVIYFMDDYFLSKDVDTNAIEAHINYCIAKNISFLKLSDDNFLRDSYVIEKGPYCNNPINKKYAIDTAIGIWKKQTLYDVTLEDYSPWNFEREVYKFIQKTNYPMVSQTLTTDASKNIGISYNEAIRRGKWTVEAVSFLSENGFLQELKGRKVESPWINRIAQHYDPKSWTHYFVSIAVKFVQLLTK